MKDLGCKTLPSASGMGGVVPGVNVGSYKWDPPTLLPGMMELPRRGFLPSLHTSRRKRQTASVPDAAALRCVHKKGRLLSAKKAKCTKVNKGIRRPVGGGAVSVPGDGAAEERMQRCLRGLL